MPVYFPDFSHAKGTFSLLKGVDIHAYLYLHIYKHMLNRHFNALLTRRVLISNELQGEDVNFFYTMV